MDKKQTLQNFYRNDFWYEYIGYLRKSTNYVPYNYQPYMYTLFEYLWKSSTACNFFPLLLANTVNPYLWKSFLAYKLQGSSIVNLFQINHNSYLWCKFYAIPFLPSLLIQEVWSSCFNCSQCYMHWYWNTIY
jgi:hypothetical protein